MDVDGGSTSLNEEVARSGRSKALYLFTQQNLPACKPVLTPAWVITTFLFMGAIFIPIGLVTLRASQSVVEIVERYDIECVPEVFEAIRCHISKIAQSRKTVQYLKVDKYMRAPIYIYYQLDKYYQNHRRLCKK